MGSENGHLVRRGRAVCREVVAHGCSGVHFRERAAAFPKRLYATASWESDTSENCRRLEPSVARLLAAFLRAQAIRRDERERPVCRGASSRGALCELEQSLGVALEKQLARLVVETEAVQVLERLVVEDHRVVGAE